MSAPGAVKRSQSSLDEMHFTKWPNKRLLKWALSKVAGIVNRPLVVDKATANQVVK